MSIEKMIRMALVILWHAWNKLAGEEVQKDLETTIDSLYDILTILGE